MSGVVGLLRTHRSKRTDEQPLDHGEVARVAYQLYEERGCAPGHALEDWLKAEAIVRRRRSERSTRII
ncbi:MAG: DUF2934 domain-containing protein [Candidatus Omnitrophica bacterium]|nr:DUF2934 domain-containing protein [Candidatus Omnitrophota bacterium]